MLYPIQRMLLNSGIFQVFMIIAIRFYRVEIESLERERQVRLQDLRVIESRSNQVKDELNIEGLEDLGKEKSTVV